MRSAVHRRRRWTRRRGCWPGSSTPCSMWEVTAEDPTAMAAQSAEARAMPEATCRTCGGGFEARAAAAKTAAGGTVAAKAAAGTAAAGASIKTAAVTTLAVAKLTIGVGVTSFVAGGAVGAGMHAAMTSPQAETEIVAARPAPPSPPALPAELTSPVEEAPPPVVAEPAPVHEEPSTGASRGPARAQTAPRGARRRCDPGRARGGTLLRRAVQERARPRRCSGRDHRAVANTVGSSPPVDSRRSGTRWRSRRWWPSGEWKRRRRTQRLSGRTTRRVCCARRSTRSCRDVPVR